MNILDLARYVVSQYPFPQELSKARLNKIIYLIDWKNTLEYGSQMTDIQWKFNHYGPYVDRIENELRGDSRFKIENTLNIYGSPKNIVSLCEDNNFIDPNAREKEIIDFIIDKTRKLLWNDFINLVYSTYPIISQEKGSMLDLVVLAKEYKEILKNRQNTKKD
ncbi:hypothetical protein Hc94105_1697 [Helicobacter cinaedi]|uniref:Panacea domain-containing protein n=1 Tax=Helicobacter cinaedi TaxID=213 RepID=UPI001F26D610|nr:Panacea domain-containing protein [Helicobacter cinaedi]BDB67474.1 hypothetical protein Hc94105_1697 [Helicobacter cinaedi]